MPATVKLDDIIEALELAADETTYYLDAETGKVHLIPEEQAHLAEDENASLENLPEWEREIVVFSRSASMF